MKLDGRYRPTQLRKVLESTSVELARKQNVFTAAIAGVVLFALTLVVSAFFFADDPGLGIFGAAFTLVIGLVVLIWLHSALTRQIAKVDFARGFLDQIFADLHPARKFHFYLDTTSYDAGGKVYWSGTSRHGNAKYRYNDTWFRHKFQLVDGTVITMERRADVKVRKGAIQKEKRRLYLRVAPNPNTFGELGNLDGLEDLVRQRVKEGFHDPPEQIRVDPRPGDDGVRIRISQWDAPIREAEAFLMIETVLLYLHMRG